MTSSQTEQSAKAEREGRLHWQSNLLLILVAGTAGAGLLFRFAQYPTMASMEGLVICAGFGILVWRLRAATPLAALVGFLLTACMYLGTVDQPNGSWRHTALLPGLALFVLAFSATRFRRPQKEQSGIAESRRGRGPSQVAANMGAAALVALLCLFRNWGPYSSSKQLLAIALSAALAEAAADTVSSEIGQALGGKPILLTTLKRVPPGTDGGVTLAGTLAGCLAGLLIALVAIPTLRLDWKQAGIAAAAGVWGLFADSLIGATVERRGWLNNDLVNFLSTVIAVLLAFACYRII
jgi:uncharacterized protein (TIGR00297 family)